MTPASVHIQRREPSGVPGFVRVFAIVDGGDSGDYTIAENLIGTDAEIREILAMSADRMATRDATRAGQD